MKEDVTFSEGRNKQQPNQPPRHENLNEGPGHRPFASFKARGFILITG